MAVNSVKVFKDVYGGLAPILNAPEYINARVLATGGTAEDFTVPAGADLVVFSATDIFYALPNGTAAAPAADVTNGSGSFLNPTAWLLTPRTSGTAISTISVVSPNNGTIVTAAFYKIARDGV